ncbi:MULTISPECIES: hypothetical protein [Lysobacteraceae]|nr:MULTISPECIES: hypothetical protein [Lysobacter]
MTDRDSSIQIGNAHKLLRDADPAWVTSQLQGQGTGACIIIKIETDAASLTLATAGCGLSGRKGQPREYKPAERELIDLWTKKGLASNDVKVGDVVSFVNAAKKDL